MFDNAGFKVLYVCSGELTLLMSNDLEMQGSKIFVGPTRPVGQVV